MFFHNLLPSKLTLSRNPICSQIVIAYIYCYSAAILELYCSLSHLSTVKEPFHADVRESQVNFFTNIPKPRLHRYCQRIKKGFRETAKYGNFSKSLYFWAFSGPYYFARDRRTTVSTCPVHGNMSTGVASTNAYPFSVRNLMSRARVAGSQET